MNEQVLCLVSDLTDPGAKGPFRVNDVAIFVVRRGDTIHAWENSCPHAYAPLEMEADHFLDLTRTYVLCSLHGAHFEIETGVCVLGPCKGRALTAYPIRIDHGKIIAEQR